MDCEACAATLDLHPLCYLSRSMECATMIMRDQPVLASISLDDLVTQCRAERSAYRTHNVTDAPACVELFRRAFTDDQDAWAAVYTLFEPLMRSWIGVQRTVDPEDVLQEALLAFARWAPNHPELLAGEEVNRLLAFLRQCTKTALLTQLRKIKRHTDISFEHVEFPTPVNHQDAVEARLVVYDRIHQLLTTAQERLVFNELLVYGLKPQDILRRHATMFHDMETLRQVIQRVMRRLRKDRDMQEL
jgi:DNA-directed RNA polymerase specialized sigma24 family protein